MSHRTLFEKIWSDHMIVTSPQGEDLLYVDFNLINEGQSFLAFDQLRIEGRGARRPRQHLAVTDHYLPTTNRSLGPAGMPNPEIRRVVEMLDENATEFALPHIGWHHRDQGIAHVIAPELGIAQPGMLITCNDSHTATNGACGALAIPIGGGNQLICIANNVSNQPLTVTVTVIGLFGTSAQTCTLPAGDNAGCQEFRNNDAAHCVISAGVDQSELRARVRGVMFSR